MLAPRGWNPTIMLWAANALVWPLAALAIGYQFGWFGAGGGFPQVQPLTPEPIRLTMQVSDVTARNPFDPAGTHWRSLAVNTPPSSASAGGLRGVIVLPGVRAAMTGGEPVYVGGQLAGGRVIEIRANKVIVQRDGENVEMEVPSAHRPKLDSLSTSHRFQELKPKRGQQ